MKRLAGPSRHRHGRRQRNRSGQRAAVRRRGAHVLIADIQEDLGKQLAESLGEAARSRRVDVTREEEVKGAVDEAVSRWGRLDVMFNNAGFRRRARADRRHDGRRSSTSRSTCS